MAGKRKRHLQPGIEQKIPGYTTPKKKKKNRRTTCYRYVPLELKPNHSFHSEPQIEIDILCVNLGIM